MTFDDVINVMDPEWLGTSLTCRIMNLAIATHSHMRIYIPTNITKVTRPIDSRAVGVWKRYRDYILPQIEAFAEELDLDGVLGRYASIGLAFFTRVCVCVMRS